MKLLSFILKWTIRLSVPILIFGVICNSWISRENKEMLFSETDSIPFCYAAILPGTSRYLEGGAQNLYFTYRIHAAGKLFLSGKIKKIILSGDNRMHDYNEPREMKKALRKMGVPDSCLIPDYAGLRTFDSMVRCKDVFGQDSVIVISQQFQNERALFIANRIQLIAFGYNAQDVTTQKTWKMKIREFFSRMKCVLDLYVFDTKPKHLGDKILI
ncbi:MAG: YdcF family protein [Sphingobacteriaceae bacterium]|nr:YdcF family protein [Sphingobacteriaceae bacterium]